jgi:hypothetical protein
MRKATISMAILLAVAGSARADEERSSAEAAPVEVAPHGALPGPIYDEKGRLLAAPPPPSVRSVDLRRRLVARPPAVREAGSEPRPTPPPTRGEQ